VARRAVVPKNVVAINQKQMDAAVQNALKALENFKEPEWLKKTPGPHYVPRTREEALRMMGKIKSIDGKNI
jgi:hypothetical protein